MTVASPLARLAAVAVVVVAGSGGAASGAQAPRPRPLTPANHAVQRRGVPFTFSVSAPAGSRVSMKVSTSGRVDARGTLEGDSYVRDMAGHGTTFTKRTERFRSDPAYFLNRPGRYYWQAYGSRCSDDCGLEARAFAGPVRTFRIR